MKHWRLIYYCLAALWLLLGLGSGNRVFFVLFFAQVILSLLAVSMNIWAAVSFTYIQSLSSEKTLHGRPVHLKLNIHNEKFLPYPMMKIRLATPGYREQRELNFNLPAQSKLDFDLLLECPYRGEYQVGMTIIDFIDIFGIVRLPFDMRMLPYYRMKNLLVYPQLNQLDSLPLPTLDSKAFSRFRFATEDQNEPFSTVRKYQRGDQRKHIHWKASIKAQTLMTRQYEEAAEPRILLILDLNHPVWSGESAWQAEDAFCEGAAALIHYLLRQDWLLHVKSIGSQSDESFGHGLADFQRYYHWLAQVPFSGEGVFADQLDRILSQHRDVKAILVITTQIDPSVYKTLSRHHRNSRPILTLFAGPARADNNEAALRNLLEQSGMPAWFMHYGERLNQQLAVKQR